MKGNGKQSNRWRVGGVILFVWLSATVSQAAQPPQVEWEKTFGGSNSDEGYCVQQTSDGGYIVSGRTRSFGVSTWDAYLVKTDSNGNAQWEKTFGGLSRDDFSGFSVQQTSDGGYIVAGWTDSFDLVWNQVYLFKTDSNGNRQWEKRFGGDSSDEGYCVQQTSDGGYIVAGSTASFGAGNGDFYLIKTDANGNKQWEKTLGGAGPERGCSVQQTSDGGYIVAGHTGSFGAGDDDCFLVKTDAIGNQQWQKTFGGASSDGVWSVQQTSDGGYILAGWTRSYGAGGDDVYLVKTDSNGNQQWQKTFGGAGYDEAASVQQTTDGGYIVAGWTQGRDDVYLIKTDSSGNLQWEKILGGAEDDFARSVQQTSDGGYVVAGQTESFGAGGYDLYLIKLASDTLPAPNGVLASDGTSTQAVHVSWNASPGASDYRVFRATSAIGAKTAVSDWQTSTTWDDTSAAAATVYHYYVKARDAQGESGFSAPDTGWRAPPLMAARPSWRRYE